MEHQPRKHPDQPFQKQSESLCSPPRTYSYHTRHAPPRPPPASSVPPSPPDEGERPSQKEDSSILRGNSITIKPEAMSLNFIQVALSNSIRHPELYSPSASPNRPSTPVVGSVAGSTCAKGSAKRNLDDISEEDSEGEPAPTTSAKLRCSRTIATGSKTSVASTRVRRSKDSIAEWLEVTPYCSTEKKKAENSNGDSFDLHQYIRQEPEEYASLTRQDQSGPVADDSMINPEPTMTAGSERSEDGGGDTATQTTNLTPHLHGPSPPLDQIPVEAVERAGTGLPPVVREALKKPRMTRAQKAAAEKAKKGKEKLNELRPNPWYTGEPMKAPLDDPYALRKDHRDLSTDPYGPAEIGEPTTSSTSTLNRTIDTDTELLYDVSELGEPSNSASGAGVQTDEQTMPGKQPIAVTGRSKPSKADKPSKTQTKPADEVRVTNDGDWDDVPEYLTEAQASEMHQEIKSQQDMNKSEGRPWYEPKTVEQLMQVPSVVLLRAHKRMRDIDDLYSGKPSGSHPSDPKKDPPPTYLPPEERDMDSDSDSNVSTAPGEPIDKNRQGVIDMVGRGWIRRHLQEKGFANGDDLALHKYKGFDIEAPKIQLIRAKNFLASQNVGNTPDWEKKFDALCQYTKYLQENYNRDEYWAQDLFDVIRQLRAHRIWEKYMYSPPKLDLDISNGKGEIYPGPKRFYYDEHSVIDFEKNYRPDGAPRLDHERGSLAGKSPGLFIQPHCIEDPPKNAYIDPLAFNKGMKWFTSEQQKWVNWTAKHALKEAYGHKLWQRRTEDIMPLPLAANWNGPVVNISMDKKMYKAYQRMKKLEGLVAKLRRTVWKTAVYGERPVLLKCIEGIDHGLSTGQGWTTMSTNGPEKPIDDNKKGWEKLPIRRQEYVWLGFLLFTSPSDPEPKQMEPQKAVLLERLAQLRHNPRHDGVFAKFVDRPTKTPVRELTEEINFGMKKGDVQRGPKKLYIFEEEEVWEYSETAEELGMVHRIEQRARDGKIIRGIGELAIRGVLPEERIRWDVTIDETQAEDEEEEEEEEEDKDEDSDDSTSDASTISTDISISSSESDYGDYTRALPKFESLLPWTSPDAAQQTGTSEDTLPNGVRQQTKPDKIRTTKFYQRLGARLGLELHNLRKDLKAMEEALSTVQPDGKDPVAKNQMFLFDTLSLWADDYNKRTRNRKNPAANGERQVPLYKDIVSIADPKSQGRRWKKKDSWADAEEAEAREIVRQGIIRENHENKTNIWPARGDTPSEAGHKFPSWRRENLWTFGAPGARGFKVKRFFSINRWPVHLQTEEIQKEIKSSGAPAKEPDPWEEASKEQAFDYEPTFVQDDGERTIWRPGNEYWLGATPRQQRAIWRRNHQLGDDPKQTWKDRITSLFTRKRKRDQAEIEQDDIDSFETGSLRLPSPKYLPKVIENRDAAERKAKAARLSG